MYDPLEDRFQRIESRVADIESGPYECPECGTEYPSTAAVDACCREPFREDD